MQLIVRPVPIVLVKVWDGDRQFVPVREHRRGDGNRYQHRAGCHLA